MEYKGKLYAKIANKYLEISHTDDFEALEGQACRLQNNLVETQETNAELRQTIIAKTQREAKLENLLAGQQAIPSHKISDEDNCTENKPNGCYCHTDLVCAIHSDSISSQS